MVWKVKNETHRRINPEKRKENGMSLLDSGYSKISETFSFDKVPSSVEELKSLGESNLSTPFKTCALTLLVLLNYEKDAGETVRMLDYLKGPQPMNPYEIQFLKDRMLGKEYVARSFFQGSSPDNNYTYKTPLQITVCDSPYSYNESDYAVLYVQSSGADSLRSLKFRRKPSTNEWFLVENNALSDIRVLQDTNPWA